MLKDITRALVVNEITVNGVCVLPTSVVSCSFYVVECSRGRYETTRYKPTNG